MNERIRELEMQVAESFDPLVYMPQREYAKEFNKRFAELIVRECAEQCTTDGPFVAEVVWGKQFHKKILEHFGVE